MAQKTILTRKQRLVLDLLRQNKQLAETFYLTGGTALAEFYLYHRRSGDLDFFSDSPVDRLTVTRFVKEIETKLGTKEAAYEHVHDRYRFVVPLKKDILKIEFVHYQFKLLQNRRNVGGLQVDSLLDIAANKLFAATDRNEPKDLIDLYFLLTEQFTLKRLLPAVKTKFGINLQKIMLAEVFYRGAKLPLAQAHSLRGDIKEIRQFYFKELKKMGKSFLYWQAVGDRRSE